MRLECDYKAPTRLPQSKTTTSAQAGARGGNELFLDGSAHWKNISQMTNYAACPYGDAYMNAW